MWQVSLHTIWIIYRSIYFVSLDHFQDFGMLAMVVPMMRKVLSNSIGHKRIFLAQRDIHVLQLKYPSFELLMWPLVTIVWIVHDYFVLWIHLYDDTMHVCISYTHRPYI
jgi:hypothetical protein